MTDRSASHPGDARVRVVLLVAWAVLLACAIGYWARYARDVPHGDAWTALVPVAVGDEIADLDWLFGIHNVHHVPVPKLLFVVVGAVTEYEFRALPLLDVLGMGAAALVLLRAARALRGSSRITDVTLCLALLHLGHGTNFLGPFRSQYVVEVALAAVLLAVVARSDECISRRRVAAVALLLVLLAGCGMNGLTFVPFLAVWPLLSARLAGRAWRESTAEIGLVVLAAALLVASLTGLPDDQLPEESERDVGEAFVRSATFLGSTVGTLGTSAATRVGVAVLVACLVSLLPVLGALRRPPDRTRALGMLAFLAGILGLAGAVGWGRTRTFADVPRYVTLLAPLLCWLHLAWLFARSKPAARTAQALLLLVVLGIAVFEGRAGVERGRVYAEQLDAFTADARAGMTPKMLASRHVHLRAPGRLDGWIAGMRERGLGPYREPLPADASTFVPLAATKGHQPYFAALRRGGFLRQSFRLPAGSRPRAVHVMFVERDRPRAAEVTARLVELAADGARVERGRGTLAVTLRDYYELAFEPFSVAEDARFELELTLPADLERQVVVHLPFRRLASSTDDTRLAGDGPTQGPAPLPLDPPAAASLDAYVELAPERP